MSEYFMANNFYFYIEPPNKACSGQVRIHDVNCKWINALMKAIIKASHINAVTQVIPGKNRPVSKSTERPVVWNICAAIQPKSLRSIGIGVRISSIRRAASSWVPGILRGKRAQHSEQSELSEHTLSLRSLGSDSAYTPSLEWSNYFGSDGCAKSRSFVDREVRIRSEQPKQASSGQRQAAPPKGRWRWPRRGRLFYSIKLSWFPNSHPAGLIKAQLKHIQSAPRMGPGDKKTGLQDTLETGLVGRV
jgi:hypothetical protein